MTQLPRSCLKKNHICNLLSGICQNLGCVQREMLAKLTLYSNCTLWKAFIHEKCFLIKAIKISLSNLTKFTKCKLYLREFINTRRDFQLLWRASAFGQGFFSPSSKKRLYYAVLAYFWPFFVLIFKNSKTVTKRNEKKVKKSKISKNLKNPKK